MRGAAEAAGSRMLLDSGASGGATRPTGDQGWTEACPGGRRLLLLAAGSRWTYAGQPVSIPETAVSSGPHFGHPYLCSNSMPQSSAVLGYSTLYLRRLSLPAEKQGPSTQPHTKSVPAGPFNFRSCYVSPSVS